MKQKSDRQMAVIMLFFLDFSPIFIDKDPGFAY